MYFNEVDVADAVGVVVAVGVVSATEKKIEKNNIRVIIVGTGSPEQSLNNNVKRKQRGNLAIMMHCNLKPPDVAPVYLRSNFEASTKLVLPPRILLMTVIFCLTLVVVHWGLIPTTSGSCLCHEHTTNLATGVSRQPVLDCGTIFHPDCGGRDFPSILSDDLWKHISLATEAPSDSFRLIGAI